jgi:hypothetical protein
MPGCAFGARCSCRGRCLLSGSLLSTAEGRCCRAAHACAQLQQLSLTPAPCVPFTNHTKQAPRGWSSDPSGPVVFKGRYHL